MFRSRTALVTAIAMLIAMALRPAPPAHAITYTTLTTTLSDPRPGATNVTYTFGTYTNGNGEMLTGISVTFPPGTDVSGALAAQPAGTVTVTGQTVTVTFTTPVPRGATYTLGIGGITNPTTPGTYNVGTITFYPANPANNNPRTPQNHPTADYVIATPELTLTITTPDSGMTVDFGAVDPETTTPTKTVTVTVTSSAPYTITRTVSGDAAAMGLTITGDATGSKPAGTATFSDAYRLAPPITTEAGVPLSAQVSYTVVHD